MTTLKNTEWSSHKWLASICSSIASLHKNGFGLALLQHKSALTILPCPQTGLVYIDLDLVILSNFLPKSGLKKSSISPKKWPKSSITCLNQLKIKKHYHKTHFLFNIEIKPPTMDVRPQFWVTWHLGGQALAQRVVHWPLSPKH